MPAVDKVVTLRLAEVEAGDVTGKIVNVYDTYAHALAHGATGLMTVKAVNILTGAIGAEIPQTAKTAGPAIDLKGGLVFGVSNGADIYLMSNAGLWGGPLKITRQALGYEIS